MFKCLDSHEQREIIILDDEWDGDRLTDLRSRGHSERLLCPECKQPVHVKAGNVRAWHFAHKDLGSCPLHSESPAVLKARVLLYRWLLSKFAERDGLTEAEQASITVEKRLSDELPRPADCYVEFPDGAKLAYWVFEKGMRDRGILKCGLGAITLHAVFLKSMMKAAEEEEDCFDLTTTERDFMAKTTYDAMYLSHSSGSLHYLDELAGTLTTLRGLTLDHAPQRHSVRASLVHPLTEILTVKTGEFVHPGEQERLEEHRCREQERRKKVQEWQTRRSSLSSRIWKGNGKAVDLLDGDTDTEFHDNGKENAEADTQDTAAAERESLVMRRIMGKEPMTCERCGRQTTSWSSCKASEGICVCRKCMCGEE